MANKFFSGRISKALSEHVEEYAKALGKNKTKILIEALTQYTDYGPSTDVNNKRSVPLPELVEQLQQQIEKHQEKLNRHEQDLKLIKNQLIDSTKPKVSQTDNNVISSSSERSLPKHNREEIKAEAEGASEKKNTDKMVCLSESAISRLKKIAEQQGVTQTEIIEKLLERDDKDIAQAIKILREIWVSRKMATGAMKNQVKDALFYLDKTRDLKKP